MASMCSLPYNKWIRSKALKTEVPKVGQRCAGICSRLRDSIRTTRNRGTESGASMCRDLLKLRLKTAEAYVKVLAGEGAGENGSAVTNSLLAITAVVRGLGPHFQLQIQVP